MMVAPIKITVRAMEATKIDLAENTTIMGRIYESPMNERPCCNF